MIAITGGRVFLMPSSTLERADILIDGDTIIAVGESLRIPPDSIVLDATGRIVLPGLINAHTHAHNNLAKGTGDNWTLEDLRNHGPAIYSNRTPEEQYLSAAIGAVEMLKTGCTAAYDQFAAFPALTEEGVEAVIRAYSDVGTRAVLAPSTSDQVFYRAVPGLLDVLPEDLKRAVMAIQPAPAQQLLRLTKAAIQRWDGTAEGRIRMATAPVIPGECSDEFFSGCAKLSRDLGVGLHTHLAETKVQAVSACKRWGKTLVAHLAEIGVLGPSFVGGHGVWITDADMRLLAESGASIAHNPASNLKLGAGIAPVQELREHGVTVGIGADGSMSSDNQNMFEAMRFAALVNKVRFPHEPDRWLGAHDVWAMATTAGARVLGMAEDIGAIAAGKKADIILLKSNSIFLRPMNNVLNSLVYAESGADVEAVLVGGRVVVEQGRVTTVDEEALRDRAQVALEESLSRNTKLWAMAERMTPFVRAACRACASLPHPINRYAAPV